jgi:pilus assembly protein CpaE
VIIDMPRAWDSWTDQVLLGSNRVFVVTDMTVPGLRLARRMAGALVQRLPDIKPRVIVNRFEQQLLFGTGLRRTDVERAFDGYLEGTVSNNYKLMREAIDRGLPLDGVKAGSNVSADLKKIVLGQAAGEKTHAA